MAQSRFQYSTGRLLAANATIAIFFAGLLAVFELATTRYIVSPPVVFVMMLRILTLTGMAGAVGATVGTIWRGEEGFAWGMLWGVGIGVFVGSPVIISSHYWIGW